MKQAKLLFFLIFSLHTITIAAFNATTPLQGLCDDLSCLPTLLTEGFGKTHFIVGFPHEQIKSPKKIPKKESSLTNQDVQALFSPDDDLQRALIDLINAEQETIKMAIFCFTDKDIAQALLNAHKRGVHIEIITDPAQLKDRYSKVSMLQQAGLTVLEYNPNYISDMRSNIMHHKFVVFGKTRVWTGSFNFTQAAHKRNQENVVIACGDYIVEKFCKQFECIKKRCIGCDKTKKSSTKHQELRTASLQDNVFNTEIRIKNRKNVCGKKNKVV